VNGVINVVTKPAAQSQGTYLNIGGGITEQDFVEARHGGRLGRLGHWKAYAQYFQRDPFEDSGTTPGKDETDKLQGGMRTDLAFGESDTLTLQWDAYSGHSNTVETAPDPATLAASQLRTDGDIFGVNLLTRASHRFGDTSEGSLQIYYDFTNRDDGIYDYRLGTLDLELQHRFSPLASTEIVWGGGYRRHRDHMAQNAFIDLTPASRTFDLSSGFVQSETQLMDERLTLGTKIEHNDYSGLEHQPSARIAFVPSPELTLWGAASRAIRTPARGINNVNAFLAGLLPPAAPVPTELRIVGDGRLRAERLRAYELGLRFRPMPRLLLDVAGFYNLYDHIQTYETGPVLCTDGSLITGPADVGACLGGGNRLQQFLVPDNKRRARGRGVEVSVRYQVTDRWDLDFSYTHFHLRFALNRDSTSAFALFDRGQWPTNQFSVRSRINFRPDLTFDSALS